MKKTLEERREYCLQEMKVGKLQFVLRKGVLDWGGTMAATFFLGLIFKNGLQHWVRYLVVTFSLAAIGGI
jgi:hypothetical protein